MSTNKKTPARPASKQKPEAFPEMVNGIHEIFNQIERDFVLEENNVGKLARHLVRMKRAGKPADEIKRYAQPFLREIWKWFETPTEKLEKGSDGMLLINFDITRADLKKLGL